MVDIRQQTVKVDSSRAIFVNLFDHIVEIVVREGVVNFMENLLEYTGRYVAGSCVIIITS
jgi:hypothetical protein